MGLNDLPQEMLIDDNQVYDNVPHSPPDFVKDLEGIPDWEDDGVEFPDFTQSLNIPVVPIDFTQYFEMFWEYKIDDDHQMTVEFWSNHFYGVSWLVRILYKKVNKPDGSLLYWDPIEKIPEESIIPNDPVLYQKFISMGKENGINQIRVISTEAGGSVQSFLPI